jgi:hypothetical protein
MLININLLLTNVDVNEISSNGHAIINEEVVFFIYIVITSLFQLYQMYIYRASLHDDYKFDICITMLQFYTSPQGR